MVFTSNGWVLFWLCAGTAVLSLLIGVTLIILHKRGGSRSEKLAGVALCALIGFIAAIIMGIMISYGVHNAQAKRDLESAGLQVESVATDSNSATIMKDGWQRKVLIYKSDQTGRYVAYLLCQYGLPQQQPINECRFVESS